MRRILRLSWFIGFCVAGLLYCFWFLHNAGKIGSSSSDLLLLIQNVTLVFRPTSVILMSLSGEHPLTAVAIVSVSLFSNGFIYMGVAYVLRKMFRALSVPEYNGPRSK